MVRQVSPILLLLLVALFGTQPDAPTPAEDPFVGSVHSDVFHVPTCRYADRIKPGNLTGFDSVAAARERGYRACKVCKPTEQQPSDTLRSHDHSHPLSRSAAAVRHRAAPVAVRAPFASR
ncbi:MAG: hypothetical protein GVY12_09770 [Bacteroidetes bacterium]|nr:hypothetical protein [Bacteroidota bacterium]